ncbi:MAG: SDR family oxidoreductase [Candidatus Cloacimonetes bacterium]|nr:SDR family oxidoreductase [Candidatus Cloacimonadota bacterium]
MHDKNMWSNQVVMVTGVNGGIGGHAARQFKKLGAAVVGIDVNFDDKKQFVELELDLNRCDVSDWSMVKDVVGAVNQKYGRIDVLVNAAGLATPHLARNLPMDMWRKIIEVDLNGIYYMTMAVYNYMSAQKYGRIINISSVAGKRMTFNGCPAYTAAKAGIIGLTRHLAYEFAPEGINVNTICPGTVLTDLVRKNADAKIIKQRERNYPIGRVLTVDDIFRAIVFLAEPSASGICGISLDIDGGVQLGWEDSEDYFARKERMSEINERKL